MGEEAAALIIIRVAGTVRLTVAPRPLGGGLRLAEAFRGGDKGGRQPSTRAAAHDGDDDSEDDGTDEEDKDGVEDDQRKGKQNIRLHVEGGVPPVEPAAEATTATP